MADLIERYKITANLPSVLMNYCNRFNSKQLESITEMIYELENSIESADVQPVMHGKWESSQRTIETGTVYCSNCAIEYYISDLQTVGDCNGIVHYCPNCGADMRGDDNG